MTQDFKRAPNNQGALINTNNQALAQYKKAKKRFSKIDAMEERLNRIEELLERLVNK